jgi:hypothetical protein
LLLSYPARTSSQWNQTAFPHDRSVSSIAVNGPDIFVGSHNKGSVLRSTDDGLNWDTVGVSDGDVLLARCCQEPVCERG